MLFYSKLALRNIEKNRRFYVPYLLASMCTAAMFYDLCFLAGHAGLRQMRGGANVCLVLGFGCIVVGIFATIFLFYTNSFLMKNRKKEIGLYNILGMEKRNIARLLLWETLFSALVGIAGGIGMGILLSKLLLMILFKALRFSAPVGFVVSGFGAAVTAILFLAIFFLNLVRNLLSVSLSKPVELLQGGNVGEREPKSRRLMALLGVVLMVAGYGMALSVNDPAMAVALFFFAVLLVIGGTYCLFTAGSISLLKGLKAKKDYYYQTRHFTSVSGMLYRMKQNAVGLASICILCTMVLVTISTTVCLYRGEDESLKIRYPADIAIELELKQGRTQMPRDVLEEIHSQADAWGMTVENEKYYAYLGFMTDIQENKICQEGVEEDTSADICIVRVLTNSEYSRISGESAHLETGHAFAFMVHGNKAWEKVEIGDLSYTIDRWLDAFPGSGEYMAYTVPALFIVLPDDAAVGGVANLIVQKSPEANVEMRTQCMFDLPRNDKEQVLAYFHALSQAIQPEEDALYVPISVKCLQDEREEFYATFGGLFFVGLFLGAIFLMATVLIIYYKQISEGYDDKARYEILQRVGMGRTEVRMSIRSQVLTVFFLPLVVSVVHLAFAFKMITKLLVIFGLTDIGLFALCAILTSVIFGVGYAGIYLITARTYYKIVES